ncbi:MAG: DUF4838 domain-containing protein, partial [Clostridia bacterium]|nr:DUF4838 domain-containing protein [Clostridia bacterium]
MKKHFRVVVCLLSVCLCLLFVMRAEAAEQGCSIIISSSATEQETYAANTLQKYLEMVTGKPVPVYFDGMSGEGFEFSVGNTNRYSEDFSQKIDGSWKMKSYDGGLAIVGTPNKGVIYGVYGFLEQYCGFRYYTAEHIKINDSLDFSALQNVDYAYNAFFEYAETDWLYSRDAEYSLANGLNGGEYRTLEERQGGTIPYIPTFVHTLSNYFCSRDVYFESNPECFALYDGKRVSSQLCLTHPKTYEIVLADVFRYLDQYHNPQASLQIITLSQEDNEMYCQCSSCAAFDQRTGSPAGTLLDFVNSIAREVKRAGYHNVALDTLAYKYSRKAPVGIFPEDNVIVRLCSIECCFSHPLSDHSCKENANFMQDLRDWSQICQRLYVWDYATNYFTTIGLFPNFGVLQSNMQTFYLHNVKGVY